MIPVRYPEDPWQSPCDGTDLPYDWVPVALSRKGEELATIPQAPVWHDGANPQQAELYSGELRCTLKALSPLLVGNEQVAFGNEQEKAELRKQIESAACVAWLQAVEDACADEYQLQRTKYRWNDNDNKASRCRSNLNQRLETLKRKHKDKKILFPLTAGPDGPVLLPGEALKGMFRHAIGALLSAPLERVDEESYSYRPNVVLPDPREQFTTRPVAAKVEHFDAGQCLLKVRLIRNLRAIEFVHSHDLAPAGGASKPCELARGTRITNKIRQTRDGRSSWIDHADGSDLSRDYHWLTYHFGLNGNEGFIAVAGKHAAPHPSALVPAEDVDESAIITVDPAVVRAYLDTIKHLKDDEGGHLSRNKAPTGWKPVWPVLKPGDLLFCEWVEPANGRKGEVISFGHNFRYRWKHLNTVSVVAIGFDETRSAWITKRRVEVSPHPDEVPSQGLRDSDEATPPRALTAVRNLFGYVIDDKNRAFCGANNSGLAALKDPFDRLAGRISFNIAVERLRESDDLSKRFVNALNGCFVFLHPTVSPKASFSRSYVPGGNRTWGDGLLRAAGANGAYLVQNGTKQFAGRKFYLHQFKIEKDANGKPRVDPPPKYNYDVEALIKKYDSEPPRQNLTSQSRWELVEYLWSDQSSIACRISRPKREFGFTVRFKDLRPYELAALTAVLTPERLAAVIRREEQGLQKVLRNTSAHLGGLASRQQLHFAHKLGHGRALGMGSVQIRFKCLRWPQGIQGREQTIDDAALDKLIQDHLLSRLDDTTTLAWFKVLQLHPPRSAMPYLLHRTGEEPDQIVKWTQAVRSEHLRTARKKGFGTPLPR